MMCSNETHDLPAACPGHYVEAEAAEYLRELVASGGHIPGDGKIIIVGCDMGATTVRVLNEIGRNDFDVREAAELPFRSAYEPEVWTPAMAEAKAAYSDYMGPKHASVFTKTTPPTVKARKAARRRAKAGRRNARR